MIRRRFQKPIVVVDVFATHYQTMSAIDGYCTTGPSILTGVVSMELHYDPKDLCIVNSKSIDGMIICESNEVMVDLIISRRFIRYVLKLA